MEVAGRAGLVAKGVLYGVVAVLAILVATHSGGKATDRSGALRVIAAQPYGEFLLFVLAAGLGGYAIWRFAQSFLDRDREGNDARALGKRAGHLGKGLLYAGLCGTALSLVGGLGGGGRNEARETDRIFDWPLGRYLVGALGLVVLAAGIWNLYRAVFARYRTDMKTRKMSAPVEGWLDVVGTIGHAGRAAVFALVGVFLIKAAYEYDPREAIGLDGALRKLAAQSYGDFLLFGVAVALLAYGVYCLLQARYSDV